MMSVIAAARLPIHPSGNTGKRGQIYYSRKGNCTHYGKRGQIYYSRKGNCTHDALNRLRVVNWASGQIDYQYDQTGNQRLGVGRLTTITETGTHLAALSSGIETRYYYDLRGNVVRQEGNVGGYAYSVGYR